MLHTFPSKWQWYLDPLSLEIFTTIGMNYRWQAFIFVLSMNAENNYWHSQQLLCCHSKIRTGILVEATCDDINSDTVIAENRRIAEAIQSKIWCQNVERWHDQRSSRKRRMYAWYLHVIVQDATLLIGWSESQRDGTLCQSHCHNFTIRRAPLVTLTNSMESTLFWHTN